ncbi:ABC transporter permease subunit [Antrihabitans sp. YC2-6]|uniref:ABC transporter permease subunit n=1 Tax=Antrihabitans sp. YC2-6 TaxID=2799498 RepID=UPI0018F57739|nr:ABC transporter permease subunit [Antrihabitans sp. YC2-6]MBJ8345947.1 ABC transporter permease subunit [Antrihabitans sp. YC2-6]
MNAILVSARAEALRLRKWPAFWVLLGTWIAMNLAFVYVFNYIAYKTGDSGEMSNGLPPELLLRQMLPTAVPEVFTQGMAMFGGALMLILGALAVGSGYGWGTWKTVFTQGPRRVSVIGGTALALGVVVVAQVLAAFVIDFSIACLVAVSESQPIVLPSLSHTATGIGTGILILGMWTLFGVLIGTLARGPALAVGLGLVWVLVIENLLRGVAAILGPMRVVTDYLPGTAAGSLAGAMRTVPGEPTPGVLDILPRSESVVALVAYLAVFAVGTVWLVQRRDLV